MSSVLLNIDSNISSAQKTEVVMPKLCICVNVKMLY